MDPTVVAAWIAVGVGILTLIGTLAAQYFGRRATSRDTRQALAEQGKQLERTLTEQRTRTLTERFATAAELLGSDQPTVGLAGVYAMAVLADDWAENRQACVEVLCGYLRMPYEPDPGKDAPEPQRRAFQAIREVRHTVIRVITTHLKQDAAVSWQRLNLDLTGVVIDGGNFSGARFSGGTVIFRDARFSGRVSFRDARFSGGTVDFSNPRDWSSPPVFPWTGMPPSGVNLDLPGPPNQA
jgi:Pentapeptide repeats (9 copies)